MPNEFETDPFGGPAAGDITFDIPDGEASVSEFAPPTGTWPARVTDIEKKQSSKGNEQFVVSFDIKAEGSDFKLRQYLTLTTAAMWKVTETFRALGVSEGKKSKKDIVGRTCMVVIHRGADDYANGEIRSKITKCEPMEVVGPGGLPHLPEVDDDDIPF